MQGTYLVDGRRVSHGRRSGGVRHAEKYELTWRERAALDQENVWPSQATRVDAITSRTGR